MAAINFTVHVEKVESGAKTVTIRKTARAKPGDRLQLYTKMRTKACRKLAPVDPICTDVVRVEISEGGIWLMTYPLGMNLRAGSDSAAVQRHLGAIARADGFENFAAMRDWFRDKHGLPFRGVLHRWTRAERPEKVTGHDGPLQGREGARHPDAGQRPDGQDLEGE